MLSPALRRNIIKRVDRIGDAQAIKRRLRRMQACCGLFCIVLGGTLFMLGKEHANFGPGFLGMLGFLGGLACLFVVVFCVLEAQDQGPLSGKPEGCEEALELIKSSEAARLVRDTVVENAQELCGPHLDLMYRVRREEHQEALEAKKAQVCQELHIWGSPDTSESA